MRISVWLTLVVALAALAAVLVIGQMVLQPNLPLITEAGFSLETITPNADGHEDVTEFHYSLSRSAEVSLILEAEDGTHYVFRDHEPRSAAEPYRVLFSGVVDGYTLPGETFAGEVMRRLMPDGRYTWRLQAVDNRGEVDERTGTLVLDDSDPVLPELMDFSVSPTSFTPNQDGISDRTQINVYLTKDAELSVYLLPADDAPIYIPERLEGRKPGEAGLHTYDYEGGVDLGADPPPDGAYTLVAVAEDAEGQRVQQTASLTIQDGGKPLAEIVPQPVGATVVFDVLPFDERYLSTQDQPGDLIAPPDDPQALSLMAISMPLGDLLVFKLTVENYSNVPIRTTGPAPGTVYGQEQRAASLGWMDEPGAWRVGLDCETAVSDYPWRWAVGTEEDLEAVEDPATGNVYYYLMPGESAVVWGAVRMTELVEAFNPQQCFAGLIHEKVEISLFNQRVGAREIELVDVDAELQIGPRDDT